MIVVDISRHRQTDNLPYVRHEFCLTAKLVKFENGDMEINDHKSGFHRRPNAALHRDRPEKKHSGYNFKSIL